MSPQVVHGKCSLMWLVAGMALGILAFSGTSSAAETTSEDVAGPKYVWKTGTQYYGDFKIEASIEDVKPVISGHVILSPTDLKMDTEGIGKSEEVEGSGTGFVVHPDGILVTCAHVVRGAVDIQAHFGEKKYKAKVIGYDATHDVALLKIEANQLACLNLGDSSHVELGEEVRVVGFPLTDMLGENVKITRGTISGINQKKEGRVFQIDASINPGNSGGPLIDGKGRVVGVAKALLTGEAIDRVGFATPIEDAVALLSQKKIALPAAAADAAPLDGPALARQATPAVALIKVRCGAGGYGITEQSTVNITGIYSTQLGGGALASMTRGQMRTESCKMTIDTLGNVSQYDGTESTPLTFERLGTLGIDPLSSDGRTEWSSSRMVTMVQSEGKSPSSHDPDFGFRPSYRPPPLPRTSSPYSRSPYSRSPYSRTPYRSPYTPPSRVAPSPPSNTPKITRVLLAMEEVRYRMDPPAADGTVTIHKEYELSTARTKESGPTLEMKGTGTIVWVKGLGVPKSMEFKGALSQSSKNITIRIPMTMTCKFSDKAPEPPPRTSSPSVVAAPADTKPAAIAKPEPPKTPVRKITPPTVKAEPVRPSYRRVPVSTGGLDKFNPDE